MSNIRRSTLAALLIAALSVSACATTSQTPAAKAEAKTLNDPFESVNRVVFDINDFLDRLLIAPLAGLYRATVPPPLRDRIGGIVNNMAEPVYFANQLMQGNTHDALNTLERFTTNTTLGVGGMFEVANDFGLPRKQADFGQTLASWGIKPGPYLVLPLFGPSNIRDAIGLGVDMAMTPWGYIANTGGSTIHDSFTISDVTATLLVKREEHLDSVDAMREGSLDFYAQLRSIVRQHRAKELGITEPSEMPNFDDYENADRPAK